MKVTKIDGADLKGMLRSGASWLYQQKDAVDALNVFPVPDGDTGSNMYMTIAAASKEADKTVSRSISKVAQAAAMGALMGARGNSGVILSQFFRGFSKGLDRLDEANANDVARACVEAASTAVAAVMRPVEGTILTVGREGAKGGTAAAKNTDDIVEVLAAILDEGSKALARTPEMLPALKEAGVVDAGGRGLLVALEGAYEHLRQLKSDSKAEDSLSAVPPSYSKELLSTEAAPLNLSANASHTRHNSPGIHEASDITFMYCTEFLVKGADLPVDTMKRYLEDKGDSLLVVGTDDIVKIHIHTNNPGTVLEYAVSLGSLSAIQINNMVEQNLEAAAQNEHAAGILADSRQPSEQADKPGHRKAIGTVAVALGEGINEIFRSLGVDVVVEGGQTMNPSIQEIKAAVESVDAESVIILPNNSNVILTAQQVAQITGIPIAVVPTRTIPQGLTAVLAIGESYESLDELTSAMTSAASSVKTGEVTFAVRDSKYNGLDIREGDFIGLIEDEVVVSAADLGQVTHRVIEGMLDDWSGLVTLYFGARVEPGDAQVMLERIRTHFPSVEVELHSGGQPLYYYIISVE